MPEQYSAEYSLQTALNATNDQVLVLPKLRIFVVNHATVPLSL